NQIFKLQKRAIRIICRRNYREPSNLLFVKLQILKFNDLVDYAIAQFMYKVHNYLLPRNVQSILQKRESCYNLKGSHMFKKIKVRTDLKNRCISVKGVNLWNKLEVDLKTGKTMAKFKKMFKLNVLKRYEEILV
ncbi:hypothetical protein LDENG_00227820, partial [Lucifuga dentata]